MVGRAPEKKIVAGLNRSLTVLCSDYTRWVPNPGCSKRDVDWRPRPYPNEHYWLANRVTPKEQDLVGKLAVPYSRKPKTLKRCWVAILTSGDVPGLRTKPEKEILVAKPHSAEAEKIGWQTGKPPNTIVALQGFAVLWSCTAAPKRKK